MAIGFDKYLQLFEPVLPTSPAQVAVRPLEWDLRVGFGSTKRGDR